MIKVTNSGSFKKTTRWLEHMMHGDVFRMLDGAGEIGVRALSAATPEETGQTAHSWGYRTGTGKGFYYIEWFNTHTHNGANIAILLQYGHGTGTGGYVAGRDYINPAMKPVFDKLADDLWKKVTSE